MDRTGGLLWQRKTGSPKDIPAYCKQGSPLRSGPALPPDVPQEGFFQTSRQVTVYYREDLKFTTNRHLLPPSPNFVLGCRHHALASSNNTGLAAPPSPQLAVPPAWINTNLFLGTRDARRRMPGRPLIVDTTPTASATRATTRPGQPPDTARTRASSSCMYAIAWAPSDKSIWGSNLARPGYIIPSIRSPTRPDTALAEI